MAGSMMRISNWGTRETAAGREVSAEIDGFRLWFRFPSDLPFSPSGDPFLAAALLPAMAASEGLEVDPTLPVSPKLLAGVAVLQRIHHAWNPALRVVPVRARTASAGSSHPGAMSFFSGGVDSTFTFLKRRREITHLVHVHGFDFYTHSDGTDTFSVDDISNLSQLAHQVIKPWGEVAAFIKAELAAPTLQALSTFVESGREPEELERALTADLNRILRRGSIYEGRRFAKVGLRAQTQMLLQRAGELPDTTALNRLLLEDAFPLEIAKQDDRPHMTAVARNAAFAKGCGKTLVPVTTNHYPFGYRYNLSRNLTQGSALASVALLLGFARAYIPAAYAYNQLIPLGSHPLTDPLWSTETVQVVHDGAEARRVDKVVRIAADPAALANLRVCFESLNDNCGSCAKCLRTAIPLALIGAVDAPFPRGSFSTLGRHLKVSGHIERIFFLENYELSQREDKAGLKKALRAALRRSDRRALLRDIDRVVFGGRLKRSSRRWQTDAPWLRRIDTTPGDGGP